MSLNDFKSTLSTATDEELIKLAGEMLGRKVVYRKETSSFGWWQGRGDCLFIEWNPLESETDALCAAYNICLVGEI